MKTYDEIEEALKCLPCSAEPTKFSGMSYESGWEEALLWVLEIENEIEPPTD